METEGVMSSGRPRAGKIGEENEVAEEEEEEEEEAEEGDEKEEVGERRPQPASEAGCGPTASAVAGNGGATGNRAQSPSFQTSSAKAKSVGVGGGRGDAGISNGDWPRVNGALNMTVSGTENSGSYDDGTAAVAEGSPASTGVASAATAKAPSSVSSSEEDDGDTPMNLSPEAGADKDGDEAMNLCPPPAPLATQVKKEREPVVKATTTFGMCAKMRLKKQRLEAFAAQEEQMKAAAAAAAAAAANVKNSASMDNRETANGNAASSAAVAVTPASASGFASSAHENDPTSALHRLAEAAQRKQEEEMMMEVESAAAAATSVVRSLSAPASAVNGRRHLLHRLAPAGLPGHPKTLISAAQLAPNTEYEVSSPPTASPLTARQYGIGGGGGGGGGGKVATPSPDSAVHSAYYSPSQSPVQSRHHAGGIGCGQSGVSSPFSMRTTPSLSRNNSDASQYSSSTTSPLSPTQFSPSHSPVQSRHTLLPSSPLPLPPTQRTQAAMAAASFLGGVLHVPPSAAAAAVILREEGNRRSSPLGDINESAMEHNGNLNGDASAINCSGAAQAQAAGISRQQLINSPCPVCGDKISGFHYGIFSCESCKGFFKRTVQNKKNYVCLRGAQCPVSIATRKKCPACRFDKCLKTGMKLEAIREDRTRGGRSTYQCSYTLPAGMCPPVTTSASSSPPHLSPGQMHSSSGPTSLPLELPSVPLPPPPQSHLHAHAHLLTSVLQISPAPRLPLPPVMATSSSDDLMVIETTQPTSSAQSAASTAVEIKREEAEARFSDEGPLRMSKDTVPDLLQEIMNVEHLWFSSKPLQPQEAHESSRLLDTRLPSSVTDTATDEDMVQTLTVMADKRLYKLVKWCKSLPLFKNILIDDQIALLINAWCELLVFSCCYRSVSSPPGVIRVSNEKSLTLSSARQYGIEKCVEKMLNFTDQLRRLKVDYFEYVSMKVIVLLTSDATGLKEPEQVRDSQEKVVQSLQQYTTTNYSTMPSKFGELLLRIPELQRVCQVGKEMLCPRQQTGEPAGFNLLMELLRGDH